MDPIRDMTELQARISALPPVAAGHVRVFRGQTANYPKMLASAFRPGAPKSERLWMLALTPFAESLTGESISEDLLEYAAYWFKMVAQHYGPGSSFLDVTKSLDVALWFALHQAHAVGTRRFGLSQGGVSMPVVCPALHFTAAEPASGWLYVMDAPLWTGGAVPKHGEVVDLSQGPALIANSPRVQRQAGCLIAGEEEKGGGDLAGLYACEPIPVALPFAGAPLVEREAGYLFPSPDEDKWYARLLAAPLIPQPDAEAGYAYGQSLGVYLVTPDESEESAAPFIDRQLRTLRPLTRVVLRAGTAARELRHRTGAYPDAATYICLESPLLSLTPAVGLWNQSVLMAGLCAATEPEDARDGMLLPEAPLENALIEFSPLEWAFGEAKTECRGIWIVRHGNTFWTTLFLTQPGDPDLQMAVERIEYSEAANAFAVFDKDGNASPLADDWSAKPFFVGLMVLRHLSGSVKPEPFFDIVVDEEGLLMVRGQAAKLVRPLEDEEDLRLHFVRYVDSGARYEGPPPLAQGSVRAVLYLEGADSFAQLGGLEGVYGRVRKAHLSGRTVEFESDAAETLLKFFAPAPDRDPEEQWMADLLLEFAKQNSQEKRRNFVFAHPVLLSAQGLQLALAAGCDPAAVAYLDNARKRLWEHPEEFEAAQGPLYPMLEGLRSRRLSRAEASALAVKPECAGLLSNTYLRVLFEPLLDEAWKGGAFPAQAAEVILDSAWAMPFERLAVHVRLPATRNFIRIVHAALAKNPDGRLLARAHEAGARVGQDAEILHELGVMELDAYTWCWPASAEYMERISPWLARTVNPMPEPAEALARASRILSEAAELREAGRDRGATLKALLQARMFEAAAAGTAPDGEELRELARRALEELDPQEDAPAVEWVQAATAAR